MKLVSVDPDEFRIGHVRFHHGKQRPNSPGAYFSLRTRFMSLANLKYVKLFLDEEDLEKRYVYLKSAKEHDMGRFQITSMSGIAVIRSTRLVKAVLNGASEADLYLHKRTVDNGESMFIIRIERKPVDKH